MSFVARSLSRCSRLGILAAGFITLLALAPMAHAGSVSFNFSGLSNNGSDASVQTYMQGLIGGAGTITVTGAVAQAGSSSYTGDGHVVGPNATAATLGTWNIQTNTAYSSPQAFIMNNQGENSHDPTSDRIVMNLTGLKVYGISFAYEIFPDASTEQPPDMTFATNLQPEGSGGVFIKNGVAPGTAGTYSATWTHSPASGLGSTETSAQYLAYYTNMSLGGASQLSFIDWPAHVGINNVTLFTTPEPASLSLFAVGLGGLAAYAHRKRRAARTVA